jgi:hypothetical protein
MEMKQIESDVNNVTISEYASGLTSLGQRVFAGSDQSWWITQERGAMIRIPLFYTDEPEPEEIRNLFRQTRAFAINYVREVDANHPANAWLYLCQDQSYSIQKLGKNTRKSLRRVVDEVTITHLTYDELLTHGSKAFCDTRLRVGLSDGTEAEFQRRFKALARVPGHVYLGAWKDNQLAAFVSLIVVDDWVELEGSFSMNAYRNCRPNDTLVHYILTHYLVEQKRRVVCSGLSSLQAESNEEGLHAFKTKMGFEAIPVHRHVVLHPLLCPFANNLTAFGVNTLLRFIPDSRLLKKAGGMLDLLLDKRRLTEPEINN